MCGRRWGERVAAAKYGKLGQQAVGVGGGRWRRADKALEKRRREEGGGRKQRQWPAAGNKDPRVGGSGGVGTSRKRGGPHRRGEGRGNVRTRLGSDRGRWGQSEWRRGRTSDLLRYFE